jgi:hypothetical protein
MTDSNDAKCKEAKEGLFHIVAGEGLAKKNKNYT